MHDDQVFEVYLRDADGRTYHKPLREGLKDFLDSENGYRITLNIEGVKIILRNSWDKEITDQLDDYLGSSSVEVLATVRL
jgi:hypothetical protein